jgi:hypothetical protein
VVSNSSSSENEYKLPSYKVSFDGRKPNFALLQGSCKERKV